MPILRTLMHFFDVQLLLGQKQLPKIHALNNMHCGSIHWVPQLMLSSSNFHFFVVGTPTSCAWCHKYFLHCLKALFAACAGPSLTMINMTSVLLESVSIDTSVIWSN